MGSKANDQVIQITDAHYVGGYKIRLIFNDKEEKIVDFGSFIRASHNPMTSQYRDLEKFKRFSIQYGDLVWGDYDMCFPIWDLYQGAIT